MSNSITLRIRITSLFSLICIIIMPTILLCEGPKVPVVWIDNGRMISGVSVSSLPKSIQLPTVPSGISQNDYIDLIRQSLHNSVEKFDIIPHVTAAVIKGRTIYNEKFPERAKPIGILQEDDMKNLQVVVSPESSQASKAWESYEDESPRR